MIMYFFKFHFLFFTGTYFQCFQTLNVHFLGFCPSHITYKSHCKNQKLNNSHV